MKTTLKGIHTALVLLLMATIASAQSGSDTVRIFFRQDRSELDENYMGNKMALDIFRERIIKLHNTPGHKTHKISIISGASPEGRTDRNSELSQKRAEVIRQYLIQHTPQLPASQFVVKAAGEDWDRLLQIVESRYDVPYRTQVMDILRNTPIWVKKDGKIVDGKKRQLQNLAGGHPWNWMLANLFPSLRHSTAQVDYRIEELPGYMKPETEPEPKPDPQPEPETASEPSRNPIPDSKYRIETVVNIGAINIFLAPEASTPANTSHPKQQEQQPERRTFRQKDTSRFSFAVKTNTLYDLALVPNIGIELILGNRWSISANWMYSWWHNDTWHWYWRTYGGDIALRHWIGGSDRHLTGHHIGLYGQITTYDFELGKRGYLGDRWSYAGGMEYGWATSVGKRLNIDFTIGLGYLTGEYKEYLPIDGCYVWQATNMRRWIGPTKAEISLVWLWGDTQRKNRRHKY